MNSRTPTPAAPLSGPFLAIVFGIAFAFFYLFLPPLFADSDTPWHIATGQVILETGHIPFADPWSFTEPGSFWLNYSWGWDLIIALMHHAWGLEGLFLFSAAWLSGMVTLLGAIILKRGGTSQDPVMITLAIAAMVLLTNMGLRPQSFSYMAALLVHAMLHWNRTSKNPQQILWTLPLFMVVWVNMHSGFIFGFVILGAYGLEAMMKKDPKRLKRLVLTGIACVAAVHVTPLFPTLGMDYLPAIYDSLVTDVNQHIKEWHPYRFQLYAGFDVLLLVLFLSANFSDRKVPVADRILTALWLTASLSSMRNFALLAIVSAPLLALRLEASLLHKSDSPLLRPKHGGMAWIGALLACLLLAALPVRTLLTGSDSVIDKQMTPVASLGFLREHYPNLRFFNSWTFGGYMIYYNRDVHKVFIDGRGPTAYPEALAASAVNLINGHLLTREIQQYDVQGYFLKNDEMPGTLALLSHDPTWKLVYRDAVASVFVRKDLATFTGPIEAPKTAAE